jgi:hypothetical protein
VPLFAPLVHWRVTCAPVGRRPTLIKRAATAFRIATGVVLCDICRTIAYPQITVVESGDAWSGFLQAEVSPAALTVPCMHWMSWRTDDGAYYRVLIEGLEKLILPRMRATTGSSVTSRHPIRTGQSMQRFGDSPRLAPP